MSWVVEWTDEGRKADLPHHSQFPTSDAALQFADDRIKGGCRVHRMTGPHGEVWGESHVQIEIAKTKLSK